MLTSILTTVLLIIAGVAPQTPPPVFIAAPYSNAPFNGTAVANVGIRGWLDKGPNNALILDFVAGKGGMGAVSTHQIKPYQAACTRFNLPSPTYGMCNL